MDDDAGSSAVYVGFWQGTTLLAFLAVLATYAGMRSWRIWRFVLHQAIRPKDQSTEAEHESLSNLRQQVALRNSGTASEALWNITTKGRPPNRKDRWTSKDAVKWYCLTLFTAGHIILFIAAGIATSQVVLGSTVVSKATDSCGQWKFEYTENATWKDYAIWRELQLNQTLDADNYVRNCYEVGTSRRILPCGKFITPSFPHRKEHNVTCPFRGDLCLSPNESFAMDSGNVTFAQIGINTQSARDLTIRRRSVCAPLVAERFEVECQHPGGMNCSIFQFNKRNGHFINNLFLHYRHTIGYDLQGWVVGGSSDDENLTAALRSTNDDHTISMILLGGTGLTFTTTHDDPMFPVHDALEGINGPPVYAFDQAVTIIGCDERVQLCNSATGYCAPWRNLFHTDKNFDLLLGSSDQGIAALQGLRLLQTILPYTTIPECIAGRSSSALQASRYLVNSEQYYLEPEQWKVELSYWFDMVMARLQLEMFSTIERPPSVDTRKAINLWDKKYPALKTLCGNLKFNSSQHTSLSTLGVAIIVGVSGLLVIMSFMDQVLVWLLRRRGHPLRSWEETDVFSLLDEVLTARKCLDTVADPFLQQEDSDEEGDRVPDVG